MPAHLGRNPIRKRQQHRSLSSPHKQHILPQLRLLAAKGKASRSNPETPALQLEHRDEQDTEPPATCSSNFNLQHPVTKESANDFTSSSLLSPDSTVSTLDRIQYAAVAPSTNIYSNRVPLTSADNGFPELAPGNLLSAIDTCESHGRPTHYPPYSNPQLQETIQNQQDQDYGIPTNRVPLTSTDISYLNAAPGNIFSGAQGVSSQSLGLSTQQQLQEPFQNQHGQEYWTPMLHSPGDTVWTAVAQSTIGAHKGQCSIRLLIMTQYLSDYT